MSAAREFAFCETVTASGRTPWHIRKLTDRGLLLGGGADTIALCGRKVAYDVSVEVTAHHLQHCCASHVGGQFELLRTSLARAGRSSRMANGHGGKRKGAGRKRKSGIALSLQRMSAIIKLWRTLDSADIDFLLDKFRCEYAQQFIKVAERHAVRP